MRTIGTVVRGVRAPIIREGDNIAEVAAASVMEAWKEAGIEPRDRDVVAVTESVVARAQGNYATLDQIAKDVREKTGGGTVGVAFPILSRNRFSLLLRGMAMGCKKIVLLLSYPSDEVGNGLVDWDKLDEAGVDPYSDVLTLEQFRKKFGAAVHPFTGVDYIDFYSGIITDAGAEVEVIFGNRVQTLCDYTDAVITCDIHTRARSKRLLKAAGARVVLGLDDLLNRSVDGSGYNAEYGLLGSNKATEETVKLFPRDCMAVAEELGERLSKASGKQVKLGDLFKSGSNYQKAISQNIIKQMKQEMKADKNKSYFLKENGNPDGFSQIKKKQQFYINKKNQVVIVFNQGEVGPMSMGSQSFVLPNKLVAKLQR